MKATVEPKNAESRSGIRVYTWGDVECISVTSARALMGVPYNLMNWKMNGVLDRAINDPEEYTVQAGKGDKYLRDWLREGNGAELENRRTAAERGTSVHTAIELDMDPAQCTDEVRPYIEQYRVMRAVVGFDILLQERQVWNLSAGYAGTLDALVVKTHRPSNGVTALVDWKTSKDVYMDYVMQAHAYLGAEFVGNDEVVDDEATALLHTARRYAIAKLSPDGWSWHEGTFDPDIFRAWLGALSFARYVYNHPEPTFDYERNGTAR